MKIGMIGLGKMGGNMVKRLIGGGHSVVVFDRNADTVAELVKDGAMGANDLKDLVSKLEAPRAIWIMVPSGDITESTLKNAAELLSPGDTLIDGGNSNFRDSVRRAAELQTKGVRFLDAGTSGGIWGREKGYCLMVGGDAKAFAEIEPIFKTLAPENGLGYFGAAGAGHYAKMVHNGIEYAMMQAYAEGFELLRAGDYNYDLEKLTSVWNHGSVVRSWLLELSTLAFKKNKNLDGLRAYVEDSGEGRWTVNEAVARAVAVPTIAAALFARFSSRQENSFALRVLSALRNEFGGHAVKKA
ncbi:MAG: decarboxylating 6-phosphogluconate dehydrogenase [Polyangiaceae bacterium]|nr:decarboxylating 6-phosphogluconate dehydrogenase [Polyangiaceae bacterium]